MPILRITNQGLCTIAVLVAVLWGSILLEKATIHQARREAYRAVESLRGLRMKRESVPVTMPTRRDRHQPARPVLG